MEKKLILNLLDPRGLSNLWRVDFKRQGIIFNCWEVITSTKVSGFEAHYGENTTKEYYKTKDEGNGTITSWEVFVPFGEVATLEWYNQYGVVVLSTEAGPLELASEWFGGGDDCYFAQAVMPGGERIELEGNNPPIDLEEIASAWQKCQLEVIMSKRIVDVIVTTPEK